MPAPEFPRADPASPDFWEMRYQAAFTPWDAGAVPARLREHIAGHRPAGRVLVPGCGSGHDVRFLAEAGSTCSASTSAAPRSMRRFPCSGPFADRLRQADFFGPGLEGPWSLVYERAFLCALPRRRWEDWGRRVAELVEPGGLLAGYFYFDAGERGPPFPLHGEDELDGAARRGLLADGGPARGRLDRRVRGQGALAGLGAPRPLGLALHPLDHRELGDAHALERLLEGHEFRDARRRDGVLELSLAHALGRGHERRRSAW